MNNETKLTLVSTALAGIFSGAALYINAVEHPARGQCSVDVAHKQWDKSYNIAKFFQGSLAFVGGIVGIVNYVLNKNKLTLWAGALLFSVIPFTFAAIMPTNKILLGTPKKEDEEIQNLLGKWGKLHAVRTVASLISFGIFLYALAKK